MVLGLGMMLEIDWSSLFKSFYEMARVKIACRNPCKIPKERLYEINKQLFLVSLLVEDVVQEAPPSGPANDGMDPDDDLDEEDDLERNGEDNMRLDLDRAGREPSRSTPAPTGKHNSKSPIQGSRTVHMEHSQINQDSQLKDFMNSGSGLQGLKLPTGAGQSDLPTSFDQQSKWMDFMKIAEGELSMAECSQILRNMELEDSENEDLLSEIEIEEEMVPVSDLKLKMEGRNLLNDFDYCKGNVETIDLPMSAVRDGVLAAEELGKPKRKKQWGPIQRDARPRRFVDDGRTMMQKA
ncbi:uncharacterized protein LOC120648300 [Panicum virgatum]|uniref:uncharacterized protein LOC120648300 n=1 Tax=Panicum virgatum TaxID=38727 RepID=UPI0019D660C9|nr:uncharacterized protein LOC120648300 [Panicum virgatum]